MAVDVNDESNYPVVSDRYNRWAPKQSTSTFSYASNEQDVASELVSDEAKAAANEELISEEREEQVGFDEGYAIRSEDYFSNMHQSQAKRDTISSQRPCDAEFDKTNHILTYSNPKTDERE